MFRGGSKPIPGCRTALGTLSVLSFLVLMAPPAYAAPARLLTVQSLSAHRLLVDYTQRMDTASKKPTGYTLTGPAGNVAVLAVTQLSSKQALFSTGPQQAVTYSLQGPPSGSTAISVTGSAALEPVLQQATSLDSTHLLLEFSLAMGAGATNKANYKITKAGSTSTLRVTAAVLGADPTRVTLTTAKQSATGYLVKAGDIKSGTGSYLDPTANSAPFDGATTTGVTGPGPKLTAIAKRQGDTGVLLSYDKPLGPGAADPANYSSSPNLFITGAALTGSSRQVLLTTGPQFKVAYTVTALPGVTDSSGRPVVATASTARFTGVIEIDNERPTVTSAISTGNTKVLVQFSKPMSDSAALASRYVIVQQNVNPEVGTVAILSARFLDGERKDVELSTGSQNEVSYKVSVSNLTDLKGNPLADRRLVSGVLIDPRSADFPGTPPTGAERVDSDGDGLFDHEEALGWQVNIALANGQSTTRQVTSNPTAADSDDDGLPDQQEKTLVIDPRDDDTDDDGLSDFAEFNEIFSDPTRQDSDGDTLYDGLEVGFFHTSATLPDTDGDQILDGVEINLAKRNPRVADLPKPALEITGMDMDLDVRFTESTSTESKLLEEKSASSTLTQSNSQEFSNSGSQTIEAGTKLTEEVGFTVKAGVKAGKEYSAKSTAEQSVASTYLTSFTESSSKGTTKAYEDSLTNTKEATKGANVSREVTGASIKTGVVLKSAGDVAFSIRNLQLTALIQDPQDPSILTPVATLLPEGDPGVQFNLGPLAPERGPIIFASSQVFPQKVESLMANPRGLIFRYSNYDITDESGRIFSFVSQEINDRTASLTIDYGGYDSDNDGQGDLSEINRVATGIGRPFYDTNNDGKIDGDDRPIVFDADGKQVGITLRNALQAIGLTAYDEDATPSDSLTLTQKDASYSTRTFELAGGASIERIFRVKRTQLEADIAKQWEILTPIGINQNFSLDDHILTPGQNFTLAFLEDEDQDRLPAVLEFIYGCADSPAQTIATDPFEFDTADTDKDGLDDRFEVMIGWPVNTERGSRPVFSRCSSPDTDNDGLSDDFEAPALISRDTDGLVLFDGGEAPYLKSNEPKRNSTDPDKLTRQLADPITDPSSKDTDNDGISDRFELLGAPTPPDHPQGYQVNLLSKPLLDGSGVPVCPFTTLPIPASSPWITDFLQSGPELFDSDEDTASDGVEFRVGGNPRCSDFASFGDSDGDGLVNIQETQGYQISIEQVSTTPAPTCRNVAAVPSGDAACNPGVITTPQVTSDPLDPDSDDDGLDDSEEFDLGTDPRQKDTDADQLSDFEEVRGFTLRTLGQIQTDPTDADSDNDKRTDGAEAGKGARIIVRVPGEDPYEAFSHPLLPDQDFDLLVDGDEATAGGDPGKANTDGDSRSDFDEVLAGRRVFVPDIAVKLRFLSLSVVQDCENQGGNSGDWGFDLGVLKPAGSPEPRFEHVIGSGFAFGDELGIGTCTGPNQGSSPFCRGGDSEGAPVDISLLHLVQITNGQSLDLRNRTDPVDFVLSTAQGSNDQFTIEGFVAEYAGPKPVNEIRVPDSMRNPALGTGIFKPSDFKIGLHGIALRGPTVDQEDCDFSLKLSYEAS